MFADGGLWANNPIMVGFTDALAIAAPDQPIEIFSLGTCPRLDSQLSAYRPRLRRQIGTPIRGCTWENPQA